MCTNSCWPIVRTVSFCASVIAGKLLRTNASPRVILLPSLLGVGNAAASLVPLSTVIFVSMFRISVVKLIVVPFATQWYWTTFVAPAGGFPTVTLSVIIRSFSTSFHRSTPSLRSVSRPAPAGSGWMKTLIVEFFSHDGGFFSRSAQVNGVASTGNTPAPNTNRVMSPIHETIGRDFSMVASCAVPTSRHAVLRGWSTPRPSGRGRPVRGPPASRRDLPTRAPTGPGARCRSVFGFPHHLFYLFLIDGLENSVYEVNSEAVLRGPANPHGNAWDGRHTLLDRESKAQRLIGQGARLRDESGTHRHGPRRPCGRSGSHRDRPDHPPLVSQDRGGGTRAAPMCRDDLPDGRSD